MFCTPRSRLAQRTLEALRQACSLLLLEDDCSVDWEVDESEPTPPPHPHRAPLRSRRTARRPGAPAPTCHVCLCPVERRGTFRTRVGTRNGEAPGGSAGAGIAARLSVP